MPTLPLSIDFAQTRSNKVAGGSAVNMYVEINPRGGTSEISAYGCAGLTEWIDLRTNAPIQALHSFNDVLYVVSGGYVYAITKSKVIIQIGNIIDTGRVSITSNSFQLIIITQAGGYILDTDKQSLSKIDSAGFPARAGMVAYFGGFFVTHLQGSDQFTWSKAEDGTVWGGNYAYAERKADILQRVITYEDDLWLFGKSSIEIYSYSNQSTQPFDRYTGQCNLTIGIGAKETATVSDRTLYWLGSDRVIYRADRYEPVRISNHAIEREIFDMQVIDDAFAFVYYQDGHKFYVITFPTENKTFMLDISYKDVMSWTVRESFNVGRWRANCYAEFVDKQLVGDYASGKIYYLDINNYTENGDTLYRQITTNAISQEFNRVAYHSIFLDVDTGYNPLIGQGANAQIKMQFSDNGGRTWSNGSYRSTGKTGEYNKQAVWRCCGYAERQRIFKFSMTDPAPFRVLSLYADISIYGK